MDMLGWHLLPITSLILPNGKSVSLVCRSTIPSTAWWYVSVGVKSDTSPISGPNIYYLVMFKHQMQRVNIWNKYWYYQFIYICGMFFHFTRISRWNQKNKNAFKKFFRRMYLIETFHSIIFCQRAISVLCSTRRFTTIYEFNFISKISLSVQSQP